MFRKYLGKYLFIYHYSSSSSNFHIPKEIKIPNKIYRDNLSVLKALSNIVKVESTSPFYPLIDDPNLSNSVSNAASRKYLLSKASGRTSAQLAFKEMKSEFLKISKEEPKIKILMPMISAEEVIEKVKSGAFHPEKGLRLIINLLKPVEAWKFYQEYESTKFSPEIIQELLNLLCYGIGLKENYLETQPEEFYFSNDIYSEWNIDNKAEILFRSLKSKSKQAYESMIMGSSKGRNPTRALELFNEMRSTYPNRFPDTRTCNLLLRSLESFSIDDDSILVENLMKILSGMSFYRIVPNAFTFNNAIFAINQRFTTTNLIKSLYSEMRYLNIEPTLGTFCVIFQCKNFRKEHVTMVTDLINILSQRRKENLFEEIYTKDDLLLFRFAMQMLNESRSRELAWKLNEIVLGGGFSHLIGKNFDTYKYFQAFFNIIIHETQDLDQLIKAIKRAVPNLFTFTPFLANSLLDVILVKKSYGMLPEILDLIRINGKAFYESDIIIRIMEVAAKVLDQSIPTTVTKGKIDHSIATTVDKGEIDQEFRLKMINSINRIFNVVYYEEPENLTASKFTGKFVNLIDKLRDPELKWKFIRFYGGFGKLLPSSIRILLESFYRENELDSVLELVEYLSENERAIDNIINLPEEQAEFESVIEFCMNVARPAFIMNGVPMEHFKRVLDQVEYSVTIGQRDQLQIKSESIVDDDDDSLSDSSSSDEDTDNGNESDNDDDKKGGEGDK